MSFNLRIFFSYFVLIVVAIYLMLNTFSSQLKPGVRQSTEDALIDMANVLSELVRDDLVNNSLSGNNFSASIERFLSRSYRAKISFKNKLSSDLRIYVTNANGIVIYDSTGIDLGEDYSQWNDVYLTLRGKYGARSSMAVPGDDTSTVMHVAAPIMDGENIIGVLTVAKPNLQLQPFIDRAEKYIQIRGVWLLFLSLFMTVVIAFLLTRSIRKLVKYADETASGKKVAEPTVSESELAKLASAMSNMRNQLDGKEYIEKYVYALTHELKSPVSAIDGAAELLQTDIPATDRQHFIKNIHSEAKRIDTLISRLLSLAKLEAQQTIDKYETINLVEIIEQLIHTKSLAKPNKQILAKVSTTPQNYDKRALINGDKFLISHALDNILQNAIEFSDSPCKLDIEISCYQRTTVTIKDYGAGIPDYAKSRIFERFYSLPRPDSGKKSSGLGLSFVEQIVLLHKGDITLNNHEQGGVEVTLTFLPYS